MLKLPFRIYKKVPPLPGELRLPESLKDRFDRFLLRMERFGAYSWNAHINYRIANFLVVTAGLAIAPSITIVALLEKPTVAAILGGILTFLLGLQSAFKFGEHSRHWERMHNSAKNIRLSLEMAENRDEVLLNSLEESWTRLRTDLMDGLPQPARIDSPPNSQSPFA